MDESLPYCPLAGGCRAGCPHPAAEGSTLGGAQREPPVCSANTLVQLFAPQGQTLLTPQFRSAQLWPRVRNPATPPYKANRKKDINGNVAGRACPAPTGWRGRVADRRGKGGRQPAPFAVGGGCPLMSGIAKSRAGHARPLRTAVSGIGGFGGTPEFQIGAEGAGVKREQ